MRTDTLYASIFLLSTFIFHSHHVAAIETAATGHYYPPSPPPNCAPPPPPPPPPPVMCHPPPPVMCPPPPPVICPPSPPPPPPVVCPPPPPPPPPVVCPPPPPRRLCLNRRLARDHKLINRIKKEIQSTPGSDPNNIISHWEGPDPCNYKGFVCARNPGYKNRTTLSGVQFNGFNLKVKFQGFIDQLTDLSICHANSNRFFGKIPSDISTTKIPFLFELDLSNNKFDGPFPTSVLQATNLTFLDLRFNNFAGSVPQEVFMLDVDVLFINNNQFIQQLPSNLGLTPALYLTFANNKFTGPIPCSIGQAKNTLLEVLFLNNQLTGCLPWEIGLLKLARVFDVSKNQLHGPIPQSFACLQSMQILNLADNQFDGVVPEMVCGLPHLTKLTLRNNFFTEVGPMCRKLIYEKVLDVSMNCIRDIPDQKPPEECAKFFSEPRRTCPDPFEQLPCQAAHHINGGSRRRGVTEVGPVMSATYGALNAF